MQLISDAFSPNQKIPIQYTGEGQDIPPPFHWSGVPQNCEELALICEDPDAPKRPGKEHPFVHWVAYQIPATEKALPDPSRFVEGKNSFGVKGYRGPMPPPGHGTHHYIFTLYALDRKLGLGPDATRDELKAAMKGRVVAQTDFIGTYERGSKA